LSAGQFVLLADQFVLAADQSVPLTNQFVLSASESVLLTRNTASPATDRIWTSSKNLEIRGMLVTGCDSFLPVAADYAGCRTGTQRKWMGEGEEYTPERFGNVDRETQMLLPPDLREWVAGDDLVHFVILAVESADLSAVATRQHGGGSQAYPPSMMMALLIYAYANGVFSSRQIERATHYHLSMRYLCANMHPDHDTICTFRRENHALLKAVFSQVLKLASTMGLLQVGTVCLDGTKIVANAAKRRTLDFDQIEQAEQRIQQQIEGLLKQAEAADGRADSSDSGGLPQELANRKRLKEKMSQARALLGEAVQQRAETRERERQQWAADPIGDEPRALSPEPLPKDRINLTDPECSLMPLSAGGYAPAYNAQVAVSGQRCALIVATEVGQQPNDRQQLLGMANLIKKAVPQVEQIVADTGYAPSSTPITPVSNIVSLVDRKSQL
jgi:transposase